MVSTEKSLHTPRYELLRTRRTILLALIALTIAIGFTVAFSLFDEIADERAEIRRLSHNIMEMENLQLVTLQAESGLRGYVEMRNPAYSTMFEEGYGKFASTRDNLVKRLTSPGPHVEFGTGLTPQQSVLLARTTTLSGEFEQSLNEGLALVKDGRSKDSTPADSPTNKRATAADLQVVLNEMKNVEYEKLVAFDAATDVKDARILPVLYIVMLAVLGTLIAGLYMINRAARSEARAEQANALAAARERADLLANELNHRVKNIFAVILAIVQLSGRNRPDAKDVTDSISSRIRALLVAHEVTQGVLDMPVASLKTLIETTVSPYISPQNVVKIQGPEILLPARSVTPLGLVLHELTTNAVKYGAWAKGGTIDLSWERHGDEVTITWRERGATISGETGKRGFGSVLMESAAQQLGGTIDRQFKKNGLNLVIRLEVTRSDET